MNDTLWAARKDANMFVGFEKEALSLGTYSSAVLAGSRVTAKRMIAKFAAGDDQVWCRSFEVYCPADAGKPRPGDTFWEVERDFKKCDNSTSERKPALGKTCLSDDDLRSMSWLIRDAVVDYGLLRVPSECPPGTMMDALAPALCLDCPPGFFTDVLDSTACSSCAAGFHSPTTNTVACLVCPIGKFTMKGGNMSECKQCAAGTVTRDGSECKKCEPGTYAGDLGMWECKMCGKGSFSASPGATVCEQCEVTTPNTTTEVIGAINATDCLCKDGFFMNFSSCETCPTGMKCSFGSDMRKYEEAKMKGLTLKRLNSEDSSTAYPLLLPGYWSDVHKPLQIFKCMNEIVCPGGNPGTCAPGSEARNCALCKEGWALQGDLCTPCGSSRTATFLFPILPIFLLPVVLSFMYRIGRDDTHAWGSWQNGLSALIFLLLSHYQMCSMLGSSDVEFPGNMESAWKVWFMTEDGIGMFNPSCAGYQGFAQSFIVKSLVPLLVCLSAIMTFGVNRIGAKLMPSRALAMDGNRMSNVFFSIIYAFFNGIATTSFSLFNCQANPSGIHTLVKDLSIICLDETWWTVFGLAIACIVVYVIGVMTLLCYIILVAPQRFREQAFQRRWKFLFIKYRASVYWWGVIILLKGVVLNLAIVCVRAAPGQIYWMMIFVAIYVVLGTTFCPWRYRSANYLDIQVHLSIIILGSLILWFADHSDQEDGDLSILAVIVSCMPFVFFAWTVFVLVFPQVYSVESKEFQTKQILEDIKRAATILTAVGEADLTSIYCRIGEWDRDLLSKACATVVIECQGAAEQLQKSGSSLRSIGRLTDGSLSTLGKKVDEQNAPQQSLPADQTARPAIPQMGVVMI